LRDIGVLKFVHQDVLEALLQLAAAGCIVFEQRHGFGDEAVQRHGVFFAQDFFAGAVGAGDFLLQRHLLGALFESVFVEGGLFLFEFLCQKIRKALVIVAGHQLVLAARKKLDEVAEELPRLCQAPVFFELEARQIPPQQDPVIH
jgi:hypothetical protein